MAEISVMDEMEALKLEYDGLREDNRRLMAERTRLLDAIDQWKAEADKYHALSDLMTGGKIKAEKRMMDTQARCAKRIKAADDWVSEKETYTMLIGMIIGFVTCGIIALLIFTHMRGWW